MAIASGSKRAFSGAGKGRVFPGDKSMALGTILDADLAGQRF
jgi:hypothetical protein